MPCGLRAVARRGASPLILEQVLLESLERHRTEKPRGHDAIGIDIVAAHPSTASFVCAKLIELFVSDTPPPALVAECAQVFLANLSNSDQIRQTLLAIFDSPEFNDATNFRNKIKTPLEFTLGAVRQIDGAQAGDAVVAALRRQGLSLLKNPVPTGYPEAGSAWLGTHMLLYRARFADELLATTEGAAQVSLLQSVALDGHMTAEGVIAGLLERTLGPHFTEQEVNLLEDILTEGGSRPFYPLAPDAETRLRKLLKAIMVLPSYQYQ